MYFRSYRVVLSQLYVKQGRRALLKAETLSYYNLLDMLFTVQFTVWLLSLFSGVNQELLDSISFTTRKSAQKGGYNELIVEKLIKIITLSSQFGKFSIMIS